ncbi:MAG: PD40 domain-containing protein [Anaerolineales bacterium]|nr:PD40 domain-containing protein [Anaerolineales bacterium]
MKKIVYILIGLTMLLPGCGTLEISFDVTPASAAGITVTSELVSSPQVAPVSLSLDSTSAEIQAAMLESATKWNTIWMDGTVTWYDPTGSGGAPQVFHEQVWLDQAASRFRILLGPIDGAAETFKGCDGMTILEMDLKNGQSQSRPLPEFAKAPQYVPPLEPGVAYPNPIWGQIGTPLSELIFSADRAQNQGTFVPVALESIAGRKALAVEWTYIENQQPSFRAWLDVETAVILKIQEFGKGGGDVVQSERVVDQVAYDVPMGDALFGLQFSEMPSFSDISGNPLVAMEPAPSLSSETDLLGQVYFFIFDHEYGNETTKLVRLPGSCVTGQTSCPEPETITPPIGLNFSLTPLVWSPNGKYAALAYPVSQDGNTANLFLFNPEEQSWQSLAEFNFIDPPIWSSDGNWLAFRVQDGLGGEDVYVVRRDGSDLTNMTASDKLPPEGLPYILSGWINDNLILRSGNPGAGGLVYLRRVGDGFTKSLFDTPWAKTDMVPSPDGSFLAYSDAADQRTLLKLLSPDGSTFRDLATFQGGSIYPILWSPDGMRIAFMHMASEPTNGQDVYMIGRDGRNLQQVYRSVSGNITTITFSPDGGYLLVQDDDATGRHIYAVNLSTLETNMLQAPGLPLDWWWLAPSWQP